MEKRPRVVDAEFKVVDQRDRWDIPWAAGRLPVWLRWAEKAPIGLIVLLAIVIASSGLLPRW